MIILIDVEKAFDRIKHPLKIKVLKRLEMEVTHLNTVKAICYKCMASIMQMKKKLKHFHKD